MFDLLDEITDPIPDHISSYHGSQLSDSFASTRASSYASLQHEKTQIDFRPMSQIQELKESSRPPTRDPQSWAITGQFKAQNNTVSGFVVHCTFLSHVFALVMDKYWVFNSSMFLNNK